MLVFEAGGPAVHSGLVDARPAGRRGRITPEQLREVVARRGRRRQPPSIIVARADTPQRRRPCLAARRGRRASPRRRASWGSPCTSTARGFSTRRSRAACAAAEYGAIADTVTLCFSKGLGCPLGAVLAGSRETIEQGLAREVPVRRRDAAGRGGRGGGALRARPPRRPPRRGSRAGAEARRRPGARPDCPSIRPRSRRTSSGSRWAARHHDRRGDRANRLRGRARGVAPARRSSSRDVPRSRGRRHRRRRGRDPRALAVRVS